MKRTSMLVGLLASGALVLTACGGGTSATQGESAGPGAKAAQGGTLQVLANAAFSHLDPARGFDGGVNNFYRLIYRTLTTQGAAPGADGTKIVPDLATDTGKPSDGGKTWTFTLKDGLFFETGAPITSADVKWGVSRAWDPEVGIGSPYAKQLIDAPASYQGPYKSGELPTIETPDAKTIVFHLKKPYADFGSVVAQNTFTPVPKGQGAGNQLDSKPIASGPYKLAEYKPGASLKLVRNDKWDKKTDEVRTANPDAFQWTFGLDPATIDERMIAGQGADADAIAGTVQASSVARIQTPQLKQRTMSGLGGCTTYMGLNSTKKPLDNVKVRQAINLAVNKQTVRDAVGGSTLAEIATSIQPPTIAGRVDYDPYPSPDHKGDVDGARKLLTEAGFADGFTMTLDTRAQPKMQAMAVAIQQALEPLKITVKINTIDTATYYEVIGTTSQQHDAAITGWCPDWPSGATFLPPLFDGRNITPKGNSNLAQLNDPGVNAKIDEIAKITDVQAANKAYGELDKQIMGLAPVVPLLYEKVLMLVGGNIGGAYLHDGFSGGIDLVSVGLKDAGK
ncbi:ABC transporter substrate-binding protein [Kribbella shirazensis]|uniref:Peptide/nickel transport system substrate-binding protein n=1 Tax=Kribbella shirazensis TaxID=1105143 RepID=A0A7X5VGN2_9ACTN|nr:ABC transporter substrate-binding protein [Kribbella shirazensis]NIK60719.1 peptide/nickel transport system substrate-binding protein [Kribbella shirazensis]